MIDKKFIEKLEEVPDDYNRFVDYDINAFKVVKRAEKPEVPEKAKA